MQDLNDKIAGSSLSASEWNQVPSEIQNVIESLGVALSGADLNQLGKAIAGYVANGDFYVDSGVSDAYVLSPVGLKKSPPAYTNGSKIRFYAGNSNTGASTVNVGGLGVVSIKTSLDTDLPALSITAGGLYEAIYYATGGWYRLIQVSASVAPEIHSITASVAANDLTISIAPQFIEFRNTTASNGLSIRREVGSTISVVVPSGATLGTLNGVPARLAVIAIDNAGTVEAAVCNTLGTFLMEDGTITTVAVGTGSDSFGVVYSTTSRSNVSYRIVGYVDITEATAGTWATSPSRVQGIGGSLENINKRIQFPQATLSGTSYDIIGFPDGISEIHIIGEDVSVTGNATKIFQVGSGSISTSGYKSSNVFLNTGAVVSGAATTTYFGLTGNNAADSQTYDLTLTRILGTNKWSFKGTIGYSGGAIGVSGGVITLGGALDRVRFSTLGGTDTFDAGNVSASYR